MNRITARKWVARRCLSGQSPGLSGSASAASRRRGRNSRRSGTTLLELIAASMTGAILMTGLSGSLYIASHTFDQNSSSVHQMTAQQIISDLMADLHQAIRFTERTANAVTFTVPDRSGDGQTETLRYAWGGANGDPLIYEYNGAAVTLASGVQQFDLDYLTRMMIAPPPPPPSGAELLLVVANDAFLASQETARKSLFESWGYTVTLIDDSDSQANYDAAVAVSEVAYVSEEANATNLGIKLTSAPIGVVNDEAELTNELGFSSDKTWPWAADVTILDDSHYITLPFTTGPLPISSGAQSMVALSGTLAPGLQIWADYSGAQTLATLEQGASLYSGGSAAGRRVFLPWGASNFDFDKSSSPSATGDGWVIRMNIDNGGILNFGQGFTVGRGWWAIPSGSISLNTWQHIAVVYDVSSTANDPLIYLDGSPLLVTEANTPSGSVRSDASINLRLGNYAGGTTHTFDGKIDDARIYDRMLNPTEISAAAGGGGGGESEVVGPTTLEVTVATGNDDAEERVSSGSMGLTSSDLEIVFEGSTDQLVGIRFAGVNVPPGATISNAYIQFQVDETNSGSTSVGIDIEATDNAATFTTSTSNISSRGVTGGPVPWVPPVWGTVGERGPDQRTPDIASLVQAVVDRPAGRAATRWW